MLKRDCLLCNTTLNVFKHTYTVKYTHPFIDFRLQQFTKFTKFEITLSIF